MSEQMDIILNDSLQNFLNMFEAYNIPEIEIPNRAIKRLKQITNTFFSTEEEIIDHTSFYDLESMEQAFDSLEQRALLKDEENILESQNKNTVYLFACGLSGYGVQNWKFQYFLITPALRMALTVPYGNAYADPEEELKSVQAAANLIAFAQKNLLDGNKKLSFYTDHNSFAYSVKNAVGEIIESGEELEKMLDLLMAQPQLDQMSNMNWMKV